MKKLFAFLAVLFVSLGAKAIINVYNNDGTKINGETGYAIYSWSSPDELVAFLNGSYTGEVYYNSSPVSSYATAQWFTDLKAAPAIKIGGSQEAPYEEVNTSCLQALGVLTGVKYLDMDLATPTEDIDFSQITVGSTNVELVTLPSGVTKEQVIAANDVLKTKGAKAVVGITGETVINQVAHYTYTLPGSSEPIEYTGEVSGDDVSGYTGSVSTTIRRELSNAVGYPKHYYTNKMNDDDPVNITDADVKKEDGTYKTSWIPAEFKVKLTQEDNPTVSISYTKDGVVYPYPSDWGTDAFTVNSNNEYVVSQNGGIWWPGLNQNVPQGTVVDATVTHNYTYKYNKYIYNGGSPYWQNDIVYTGTTPAYQENGNWYGQITNNTEIEFPVTSSFSYTYNNLAGEPVTIDPSSTPHATGYVDLEYTNNSQALTKTIVPESSFVVDGMTAIVNEAGYLDDVRTNMFTKDQLTRYKGAKNINILGNVNNSDLTELSETNYGSVEFLNIADVTVASGSSITSLDAKGTAAILLPRVTEAELGTLQAKTVTENYVSVQKYHCLAYFEDENETNLNIYAFDEAVGKLGAVVDPGVTAITFIPRYTTSGVFYSEDNEHGFIGRSSDEMNQFRAQLKNLPAISMDLSILNQKYMLADFSGDVLSPHTHYLTLFGNVDPGSPVQYRANYDFTNENSTAIKYPSTVWVVSTFKVDEAHAFVLDEDGNKILISGSEEEGNAVYQRTGAATNVHYGGSQFLAATEPTNLVYVRDHDIVTAAEGEEVPSSLLEGAKNYFHGDQLYATRQIFMGDLTADEIAAIDNDIHGDYFDFMYGANFTQTETTVGDNKLESIANLDNDNVKYILLPDNHEYNINATNTDNCSFSTCDNLLCVGAYNTTTNTLTTWSSAPGNVYVVTSKIRPQKTGRGTGLVCASLNNVVMSGYLNLADISTGTGNGIDNGLEGAVVKNADLSKAYFPNQEDMVFCPQYSAGGASWDKNIETLLLPSDSRQTLIPAHSLHGSANLNELCVPYNYETIGEDAFGLMGAKIITTTDADGNLIIAGRQYKETDAEGNLIDIDGDIIPNKGLNTFSLSSNLKSIGTMAFWTGNKGLRDVYVLAATAPRCAADAFNSENYCGNIGFEGNFKHPITRDNYHNGDDIWYTILHFPSDINVNEAKKYTDITRDYSLIDETSAFDGKGQLKHWPNHSEISRAYDQALSGVIWNDWPYMTEDDYQITLGALPAVLKAKGYTEEEAAAYVDHYRKLGYEGSKYELRVTDGGNEDGIGTIPDGTITATYYKELQEGVTPQTCDFYDYIGWHQFVLTDYYRYEEIEVDDTPKNYTKLDYYTLCFPYDLTRQEVIDLIGAPNKNGNTLNGKALTEDAFPEVYTLKSVIRNQQTQHIDLGFSKELMAIAKTGKEITVTKDEWNYNNNLTTNNKKAGNDKAIFLKGGYPYLVRPIVPEGTSFSNLAEYMMSISDLTADDLGYQKVTSGGAYISVPYSSQGVISTDENGDQLEWTDEDGNKQNYYYFFQGTYENEDLPKYAYYLGQKNGKRSFFYDTTGTRKWNRFSAIIGGRCPTDNAITYIGFDHGTSSKTVSTVTILMRNADDSFNPANNDVKVNFTFEGEDGFDETVAIESINGEAVNSAVEGDVYSVTGQFVGKSVNGLSKGLYIVNGKKVMVK